MASLAELKTMTPRELILYWIQERERVRIKKEIGDPKPWTTDPILQRHKFCNVRRMDDKVSKWLEENWYKPYYDHKNMLTACTLARQLNNIDSLEEVGFPERWNPKRVQKILDARVKRRLKNFAAAYMITGTLGGTKIEQVVWKVVDPVHKRPPVFDRTSLEALTTALTAYAGFSGFIGGQVSADARQGLSGSWDDKDSWAPMGPGSKRGINRFLGKHKSESMNKNEFQEHLQEFIQFVKDHVPKSITRRMEAIDYQNCLCEGDKFIRTVNGEGTPKQRYPGTEP